MKFKLLVEKVDNEESWFNSSVHKIFDEKLPHKYVIHHFKNSNDLDSIILIPDIYEDWVHNYIHNLSKDYETHLSKDTKKNFDKIKLYLVKSELKEISLLKFLSS